MDADSYNLKTLFKLHDKNGNGYLDEFELETLFLADLDKAYPEGIRPFSRLLRLNRGLRVGYTLFL